MYAKPDDIVRESAILRRLALRRDPWPGPARDIPPAMSRSRKHKPGANFVPMNTADDWLH